MSELLFIINDAPYGSERADNAVGCAKNLQKIPDGYYNIPLMLAKIIRKGDVAMCGTCMDARGLPDNEVIEGALRSTLYELADWTLEADKVLVF